MVDKSAGGKMVTKRVVLIHDAAVDEYISTMLLTLMPEVELAGVIIVNADCIAQPALDAASKLQQFLGKPDIPLALSRARGWNAFPWSYRGDCVTFGAIPSLAPYQSTVPTPPPSGEDLLFNLLVKAVNTRNPLTLLITGPFTPVVDVLSQHPELRGGIETVVWMGGAINVPGNLAPSTINPAVANTHAEWNAFWDPFAVDSALQILPSINLFPLDITNNTKLTPDFLSALSQQGKTSRNSQLAFEGYSLVKGEEFYDMWDVTATYWLHDPSIYTAPTAMPLKIVTWGFNQGWIQADTSQAPTPSSPNVFFSFANQSAFYSGVLGLLA
jgi:purine nucleosidase